MSEAGDFFRIGLIVTGKGEERFLPRFFRELTQGRCHLEVVRRVGQRSPITSPRRVLKMLGTGKTIPDKDVEEIGLPVRQWLRKGPQYILLLVDDLEHDRRSSWKETFQRYRKAVDTSLVEEQKKRASVHFMVNMLEAYYFADTRAINEALSTNLEDHEGDVEEIPHPKKALKRILPGFSEIRDGETIAQTIDLQHVLSNPETCASLRTLVAWCFRAMHLEWGERFRLDDGKTSPVTSVQIEPL